MEKEKMQQPLLEEKPEPFGLPAFLYGIESSTLLNLQFEEFPIAINDPAVVMVEQRNFRTVKIT